RNLRRETSRGMTRLADPPGEAPRWGPSLVRPPQRVRDHVVARAETGSAKFPDHGPGPGDPTDPLGEESEAAGPRQRGAVRLGTASPGQVVEDHFTVGARQRQGEHGLFPRIEPPTTHRGGDRVRYRYDLPAGVMDRPDDGIGRVRT